MKALTHELRLQILGILTERIASPKELSNELGEGLSQVSYHVKVLRDLECIELVDTAPRRGAVEHYYRATPRAFLSDRDWANLPASIRPGLSANVLRLIMGDAVTALEEETLDARDDRQLSRTLMILDDRGWGELVVLMNQTRERMEQIEAKSTSRLTKSGQAGFTVSGSLMAFELPETGGKKKPSKKAGGKGSRAKKRRS
jgi:DNA-binding transcriptional ArsR family regulator